MREDHKRIEIDLRTIFVENTCIAESSIMFHTLRRSPIIAAKHNETGDYPILKSEPSQKGKNTRQSGHEKKPLIKQPFVDSLPQI